MICTYEINPLRCDYIKNLNLKWIKNRMTLFYVINKERKERNKTSVKKTINVFTNYFFIKKEAKVNICKN